MAILAYDDVMLREPRLLVPRMAPLGPVKINEAVFPGCAQAFVPNLFPQGVIGVGAGTAPTFQNQNGAMCRFVKGGNRVHRARPNTSTEAGESFTWQTPDYNAGADGTLLFYGHLISDTNYFDLVNYGGANWGLRLYFSNTTTAAAAYVDSPTTAGYTATMTVPTITTTAPIAMGAIKSGTTVTLVYNGTSASASGGNGGLRRSAGSGIGYMYGFTYTDTALIAMTSAVLSVAAMQAILRDPFSILIPA